MSTSSAYDDLDLCHYATTADTYEQAAHNYDILSHAGPPESAEYDNGAVATAAATPSDHLCPLSDTNYLCPVDESYLKPLDASDHCSNLSVDDVGHRQMTSLLNNAEISSICCSIDISHSQCTFSISETADAQFNTPMSSAVSARPIVKQIEYLQHCVYKCIATRLLLSTDNCFL